MKTLPRFFKVTNQGDSARIQIRGVIGSTLDMDTWTIKNTEEEVLRELEKIVPGKPIDVHINSKGGEVGMALGIYNAFRRRASDITTHNDGYALSSASILMLGGSKSVSPDSSVWMMHRASAGTFGNAEDKLKDAEMLEAHDKVMARIYADKTGKPEKEMMDLMAAETWLTGKEARLLGLGDDEGDEEEEDGAAGGNGQPDEDGKEGDGDGDADQEETEPAKEKEKEKEAEAEAAIIATFRNIPENLRSRLMVTASAAVVRRPIPTQGVSATPKSEAMRDQMIAALAAEGITLPKDAKDEEILSAFTRAQAELKSENKRHKEAQKIRVEARVQKAVDEKRIKPERQATWIARGMANERELDELDEIPAPQAAVADKPKRVPNGVAPIEDNLEDEGLNEEEMIRRQMIALYKRKPEDGAMTVEQTGIMARKLGILGRKLTQLRGVQSNEVKFVKASN